MKFNVKMLAAAAVLAVAGTSANAAIGQGPGNVAEIIFAAYDYGAQISFVLDTNIKYGDYTGTNVTGGATTFSTSLNSLASWNTFVSTALADPNKTGIVWAVLSGSTNLPNGALLSNGNNVTSPNLPATAVNGVKTGFASIASTAGGEGNPDLGVIIGQGNGPRAVLGPNGNFNNQAIWNITESFASGVASDQNMFSYINAAQALGTLKGTAAISAAGVFSLGPVAPVPEPGTYALMLAGLATLGFIGRRRAR